LLPQRHFNFTDKESVMKALFAALLLVTGMAVASDDLWMSHTHHEGDTPYYTKMGRWFLDGNQLWALCSAQS
jgi:hypothetical protein